MRDLTDEAWMEAYCSAFRAEAKARKWREEDIESGWLDEWPREALWVCGIDADPEQIARADVQIAEREASDA